MPPRVLAMTQFALARALGGNGADGARARDLATRAESALREAGPAVETDRAQVAAWLKTGTARR